MAEYHINYTQSNFTGGLIAAELYGRNDFGKVKTGLKKCINWTIREAGGLEFRRGTKYLATVPAEAGDNFRLTSINETLLVFGPNKIYYLKVDNTWDEITYPQITLYAWEDIEGSGVYYTRSATPVEGELVFDDSGQFANLYVTNISEDRISIKESLDPTTPGVIVCRRDDSQDTVSTESPNLSDLNFTEIKRRLYYYDGRILLSEVRLDSNEVPYAQVSQFEDDLSGVTLTNTTQGTQPDPYVGTAYRYAVALVSEDGIMESVAKISTAEVTANAELGEDTQSSHNQYIHLDVTIPSSLVSKYANGQVLFFKRYQGKFYYLNSAPISTSVTYDDKGEYSVDLSKAMKEKPVYLTSAGHVPYVNSIADYGQRLFLTLAPEFQAESGINVIFSELGNTEALAYSSLRNDDEAGHLEIPISNYDSWGKLISGLDLIFATSYTIQRISGYGDMQIEPLLLSGVSKTVEPVKVDRSLIYVGPNNRNLYDLSYNEYGQYSNPDLTLLIKYLFEDRTIKRVEYKDYPVKTVYVLGADNRLYCLTYLKDQNIYAWYQIQHFGKIHDMRVINKKEEDDIYFIVKDNGSYLVERAYYRTDNVYTDATVRIARKDVKNNQITGLPSWMNGKKVRVFDLGNNLYYGDYDIAHPQTIEEGGNLVQIEDLDFDGYEVIDGSIQLKSSIDLEGDLLIGMPYYAVAETIPLEFSDSNGNSTIGRKKTITDAYLRYGDSRGITYKVMGKEYDCGICKKDQVDNAEFLERGQIRLDTVSEYRWDSTIKLLQRQPYPARIESITLGLNFNDKS